MKATTAIALAAGGTLLGVVAVAGPVGSPIVRAIAAVGAGALLTHLVVPWRASGSVVIGAQVLAVVGLSAEAVRDSNPALGGWSILILLGMSLAHFGGTWSRLLARWCTRVTCGAGLGFLGVAILWGVDYPGAWLATIACLVAGGVDLMRAGDVSSPSLDRVDRVAGSVAFMVASAAVVVAGYGVNQRALRTADETLVAEIVQGAINRRIMPLESADLGVGHQLADVVVGKSGPMVTLVISAGSASGRRLAQHATMAAIGSAVQSGDLRVRIILLPGADTINREAAFYAGIAKSQEGWIASLLASTAATAATGDAQTWLDTGGRADLRARRARAVRIALEEGVTTTPAWVVGSGSTTTVLSGDPDRTSPSALQAEIARKTP